MLHLHSFELVLKPKTVKRKNPVQRSRNDHHNPVRRDRPNRLQNHHKKVRLRSPPHRPLLYNHRTNQSQPRRPLQAVTILSTKRRCPTWTTLKVFPRSPGLWLKRLLPRPLVCKLVTRLCNRRWVMRRLLCEKKPLLKRWCRLRLAAAPIPTRRNGVKRAEVWANRPAAFKDFSKLEISYTAKCRWV